MKLYYAPQTRAFRILWMLEELEVPYELERVDLAQREQKSERYLALNPMGKVPTLQDGSVVVAESGAICTYLADKLPEKRLAPAVDALERGAYLRWMFFSVGCIEPAFAEKLGTGALDEAAGR